MPGREGVAALGAARSRLLRYRVGSDLGAARIAGGLSVRQVARVVGVSPHRSSVQSVASKARLTIDLAARIAPAVGLQLAASLHLNGDPVRDRAQLALLDRFRRRLHASLR